MYVYNRTVNIDESVCDEWLTWMQNEHIPETLNTEECLNIRLFKVLINEEMGGHTYSTQYFCKNIDQMRCFYQQQNPKFTQEMNAKFPAKFVAFETELQLVNEF